MIILRNQTALLHFHHTRGGEGGESRVGNDTVVMTTTKKVYEVESTLHVITLAKTKIGKREVKVQAVESENSIKGWARSTFIGYCTNHHVGAY